MPAYDVERSLHVKLGGDWSSYLQPIVMTAHDYAWDAYWHGLWRIRRAMKTLGCSQALRLFFD